MIDRVFVYGTLMIPEVMTAVTGKYFNTSASVLRDYTRRSLRDRVYPGIRKSMHASVQGYVYQKVDGHSLALLDAFEGEEFRRIRVNVTIAGGKRQPAYAYVIRARYVKLMMLEDWDLQRFMERDLKQYLQRLGTRNQGRGVFKYSLQTPES